MTADMHQLAETGRYDEPPVIPDEPPTPRRPLAVPLTLLITVAVGMAVVILLLSRMR